MTITPPYNPHIKYVYMSNNLFCLHCGRNGHLKGECKAWKESQERFDLYKTEKSTKKGAWSCSKVFDQQVPKVTSLGMKNIDYPFICFQGTQVEMGSQV